MVNKRRSELQIMEEILDFTREGAKKTEILYQSNTNFAQLEEYLHFLLEKDLLKEKQVQNNSGSMSRLFITTKKGTDFLREINKVYTYLK
jgi:predicted transcriptional regulator